MHISHWTIIGLLSYALCMGCTGTTTTSNLAPLEPADGNAVTGAAEDADALAPTVDESSALDIVPATVPSEGVKEQAKVKPDSQGSDSISLGIGDPAPPIAIAKWFKGDAVEGFESGNVYVVEFWATWCGPCRAGMPHISSLQEEYGEKVAFIGVTREDEGTVARFMEQDQSPGKTWDEVIQYRIALDEDSQTNELYMEAAGQRGIPAAFVVGKDGFIEWIGHPATIDQPLADIVADNWDREAAAVEFREKAAAQEALMALQVDLSKAMQGGDHDKAIEILDGAIDSMPSMTAQFLMLKSRILKQADRAEEAVAIQPQLIEALWDEPMGLNQVAWEMATSGEPSSFDAALKAATRAAELTDHKNAAILDTLARVYHEKGDLQEAITIQKKAVELESGMDEIRETLEAYEAELKGDTGSDSEDELFSEEADVEAEE